MRGYVREEIADADAAVRFLKEKAEYWSFSRLLEELYEGTEPLGQRLSKRMTEYEGQTEKETVERKVRNWLHDRNLPKNREELFKICFALDLDEGRAETLLGTTAENGIHYRNPRELIYAYCLRMGESYTQARDKAERLWEQAASHKETERTFGGGLQDTKNRTASIKNEFKCLKTERELEEFLIRHEPEFGIFHNTAYRKFQKMLKFLTAPDTPLYLEMPKEKEYSVEQVVEEYLRMGVPYGRKSSHYTRVEKEIKRHWPSPKTISEMQARKRDVDRKTLLLLYLATEGMTLSPLTDNRKNQIKLHYERINLMLADCGMALLNLHSPFDYLVVQALNTKEEEFIGFRMERMLRSLFGGGKEKAYVAAFDRTKREKDKR